MVLWRKHVAGSRHWSKKESRIIRDNAGFSVANTSKPSLSQQSRFSPEKRSLIFNFCLQEVLRKNMPYLIGTNAIRRTIKYLEQGKLIFRKNVKIMTLCCDLTNDHHQGARDFLHWNMCQVMYKNPDVQVHYMKNRFPTPFVRCWLDTGEDVLMDVFDKTNVEILNQLVKTLGQPQSEKTVSEDKIRICDFGSGCARHCLCEVPGQFPCPSVVQMPKHMTGKYKLENNLLPQRGLYRA